MSKLSTMFRSVSYGPCSHTGVTCVASDFGGIHFDCRWQADGIPDLSVYGRGSLSDAYGLLHFSLVPVGFTGHYFCVFHGH